MANEVNAENDWETIGDMLGWGTRATQLQGTVNSRADYPGAFVL